MDITELKHLQQLEIERQTAKTEEAEELLLRVLNSMSDALLLIDGNGRVVQANRAVAGLLRLRKEEIPGRLVSEMLPGVLPDVGDLLEHFCDRQHDVTITLRDGRELPLNVSCGIVPDKSGRASRVLVVLRDLSERKRAEMTEKLAATGRLAATIAHEINNPLEAVTNLIFLAKSHPALDPAVQQYLWSADEELGRVSHIARQTLGFYRETSTPATTRITDLLEGILVLYSRKMAAKELSVERRFESTRNIRVVLGEIRQVFSNLIANAIDASKRGGRVIVHVSDCPDWRQSGVPGIRVTVADQGNGIHPANRARVFEPFFSTKTDVGTGLGLWVSRSLVQKHGGRISFRTSTRHGHSGTIFSVFLPC